jgi:hypothetical protein
VARLTSSGQHEVVWWTNGSEGVPSYRWNTGAKWGDGRLAHGHTGHCVERTRMLQQGKGGLRAVAAGGVNVERTWCCTPCRLCLSRRELAVMRCRGGHSVAERMPSGVVQGGLCHDEATMRCLGVHVVGSSGDVLPRRHAACPGIAVVQWR